MGPLSGKQKREYMKFAAKERRESAKAESEESRKQELHEIKLQAEADKANQAIGHKEDEHKAKMHEVGGPIGKGYALGSTSIGKPLSGRPHLGGKPIGTQQHPVAPSDTVPAMLTPGEAVIPKAAAQDPRNKAKIAQMVQQGRKAQGVPPMGFAKGTQKVTGLVQTQNMLPIIPTVGSRRTRQGYADGTTGVEFDVGAGLDREIARAQATPADPDMPYNAKSEQLMYLQKEKENLNNPPPIPDPKVVSQRAQSELEAMDRELARQQPGSEQYKVLMDARNKMVGVPTYSNVKTPSVIVPKPSQYDVQVVSPNWLTKENKSSPNAALRAQGANPVVVGDQVVNRPALPSTGAGAGRGSSKWYPHAPSIKSQTEALTTEEAPNEPPPLEDLPSNEDYPEGNTQLRTPLNDQQIADITRENQAAIDAHAKELAANPDTTPQQKHTEMTSFIESIFGPKGMFNPQELTRFALVAAGGMLTGGSVNGSFKFAAKDVLQHSDTRLAAENTDRRLQEREAATSARDDFKANAADQKTTRLELLRLGYPPDQVDKYISGKMKDPAALGNPVSTLKPTGATPRYLTTQEGPMQDKPIKLEERETMQGSLSKGKQWGTYVQGQWVPENQIDRVLKTTTIPYLESEHSPTARAKQLEGVQKDVRESVDSAYKMIELGKGGKQSLEGLPSSHQVATRAINVAKDLGFDIRDPNQRRALGEVIDNATNQMVADHKAGGKPKIIDQYIQSALIQNRTGVTPDKFEIDGKLMVASKVMSLVDLAGSAARAAMTKRSGDNKPSSHEVETAKETLMSNLSKQWEDKSNREERVRYEKAGSTSESPFYRFATAKINNMLKK